MKQLIRQTLKQIGVGKMWRRIESGSPWLFALPAVIIYIGLLGFEIMSGKRVKFVCIYCSRIGHLAAETELFLRRLEKGIYGRKNNYYIGLCSAFPVSNRQLLAMFKRRFFIIENMFLDVMIRGTWLRKSKFYHLSSFKGNNEFNSNEYFEFNNIKPTLTFSPEEEAMGKKMLAKMGIEKRDWFMCFQSRDRKYLGIGSEYHDYRDCNINNYLKAAEYIAGLGGYAIRMGAAVDQPLSKQRPSRIIDYATEHRSDFMDIYLSAKCKFFLGNTAGLFMVPTIFGVPVAAANFVPLELTTLANKDLFIPKKYRREKDGKYLKYKEVLELGAGQYYKSDQYTNAGISVVENSADEILALAIEMNSRIDGNCADDGAGEALQARYRALFGPQHACYNFTTRVGKDFLMRNVDLL